MNISRQPPETNHFSEAAEEPAGPPHHRFLLYSTFSLAGNMEEANKLIGLGKKHLVMGKVVEAVNTLQEACGMLAKKYGDTADECGEAFYWCGKALLDLARMENSVLGNALQGVPEDEEDDDEEEEKPKDSNVEMESTENLDDKTRDELRVQVYDAMAEKEEQKVSDEKDESTTEKASDEKNKSLTEKADDTKEKTDNISEMAKDGATEKEPTTVEKPDIPSATEKAEENKDISPVKDDSGKDAKVEDKTTEGKKIESEENVVAKTEKDAEEKMENEEAEEDSDEEGDKEAEEMDEKAEGEDTAEKGSDDEEVGNLQLAWEMLEMAKVIYKRKEAKEDQLMVAQTHLKLGEVSAESGNYTQAIEDFQECLKLQLKHLESDSRLLAETHYQLGLTYSLNCQYKQAIDELNSSISVIKSRLEKLQELIDKAEGPDALPEERKEMDELKALLPEIQEKVEDATEGLKTASTDAEAVKDVLDRNTTPETSDKLTSTKANGTQSDQTTASDISHLVRKKRKPEESPVKEVKKMKQDDIPTNSAEEPQTNEVNTNGQNNGPSNSMEVESN